MLALPLPRPDEQPPAPPGWYAAPGNPLQRRYWDGRAWTRYYLSAGEGTSWLGGRNLTAIVLAVAGAAFLVRFLVTADWFDLAMLVASSLLSIAAVIVGFVAYRQARSGVVEARETAAVVVSLFAAMTALPALSILLFSTVIMFLDWLIPY